MVSDQLSEDRGCSFLHHDVDQVLLIALEDNGEEEQSGGFLVPEAASSQVVKLLLDEEVPPGVHHQLSEHAWSLWLEHESCVDQRDALKADWVAPAEGQELQVYLGELDIELPEVRDVVLEQLVDEGAGQQLVLQGCLA